MANSNSLSFVPLDCNFVQQRLFFAFFPLCFPWDVRFWFSPDPCQGCETPSGLPRREFEGSVLKTKPHGKEGKNQALGLRVGKAIMSRMLGELVSSMTSRSMPRPRPPVGGMA